VFEYGLTLAWISRKAIHEMRQEVERQTPFETGGCLLGYWGKEFEEVVIEECIGAGPKAKHCRFGFSPDSQWQTKEIAKIYESSGRISTYIGDWHSHPEGPLILSWKDRRTLLRIATYAPARAPHPLMALISSPPFRMRIWKTEALKKFFLSVDSSECEYREY
jgi:integrative and conjugative element protein (TIGR02256 family)